jgi:hypothetical protein
MTIYGSGNDESYISGNNDPLGWGDGAGGYDSTRYDAPSGGSEPSNSDGTNWWDDPAISDSDNIGQSTPVPDSTRYAPLDPGNPENQRMEAQTSTEWWGARAYNAVRSYFGDGTPTTDMAVERSTVNKIIANKTKLLNSSTMSDDEKTKMLMEIKELRMYGKGDAKSMEDMFKVSQIAFGGLAAYFAYKASKREEELANKSPEELGREAGIQAYTKTKTVNDMYDVDNPDTGGGGGGESSKQPIVTYKPGSIAGRI